MNRRSAMRAGIGLALFPLGTWGADRIETVRHEVIIRHGRFVPDTLRVRAGDTVVWHNADIVPHTATAVDRRWDTGHLAAGASAEMRVSGETASDYFCLYHPSMKATLRRRA